MMKQVATALAATVGVGLGIYAGYKLYKYLKASEDEGFVEAKDVEPRPKKVLVLGLSGAGKTKILSSLSGQEFKTNPSPTNGFDVISMAENPNKKIDVWEIGGAPNIKKFWLNFVQDTDMLVFVIDASDKDTFVDAYNEMHVLLSEPRLSEVPFIVLANKQDKPEAATQLEIKEVLALEDIKHHRVRILLTAVDSTGDNSKHQGINEFERLIKL